MKPLALLFDEGFFARLVDVLLLRGGYNTNLVLLGTTLLGFAAGVVGVFMLLRKRALVTDALSHATLPGIAVAYLVAGALSWDGRSALVLLGGAAASGVLSVLCIHFIRQHSRLREDAAIGIVLSVFFGAGVVGLSYIQKNAPEGAAGLTGLIYGSVATMRPSDVVAIAVLAFVCVVLSVLFRKEFALVSFDSGFAGVSGWPVRVIDLGMMGVVVLVTVAGLQAVGILLVIAMLIVPAVSARFWTERMGALLVLAGAFGAMSGFAGAAVSALLPSKPAGAVIVLVSGGMFVMSLLFAPARGVFASWLRRVRLRLKIAGDHLLELAYERGGIQLGERDVKELAAIRGWPVVFRWLVLGWLRATGQIARGAGRGVRPTGSGLARGARVARNHELWEQYLILHADVAPSHVDWSVDQIEHILPDALIKDLEARVMAGAASRGKKPAGS